MTLLFAFPLLFQKAKMSYQIDKACDIITTALTIRLGKGGITDARTSQNSTYRSHREYHLMAGDSLVRRSLRQVILFENQIQTTSASPCRTQVQPTASFLVCSLIFIEYNLPG